MYYYYSGTEQNYEISNILIKRFNTYIHEIAGEPLFKILNIGKLDKTLEQKIQEIINLCAKEIIEKKEQHIMIINEFIKLKYDNIYINDSDIKSIEDMLLYESNIYLYKLYKWLRL